MVKFLEHMLYEFKLGHNTAEITKNICCAKDKRIVDHSPVPAQLDGTGEYTECTSAER